MKHLIHLLILAITGVSYSQEYKIEKITTNDFLKQTNDTLHKAIVEYNIGSTHFSPAGNQYQVITTTKTRIKILTKDGYDLATVKVPLYRDQSTREFLTVSNAVTYNLVNGEVEKTKLKNDGEFFEKVEGNHYLASFTMPNVKEGSIIEYTTKIISPYFTYIPEWHFQLDIPVKHSEISLRIPEFLTYYKYIKGTINVNQITVGDSYIYKATNIPALKDEGFVNNINNYRSAIIHTFSGYREQNGSFKMVAGSWEDVVKTINKNENFGKQFKNLDFFTEVATPIIVDKKTDEEKADAIFNYVKTNFTSDKNVSIYSSKSLKEVFKSKIGNVADINLLTIALMKGVKINANPIVLATRSKGIAYMPSADAFNNVIIGVELPGKTLLYDASNKFSNKNIIPIYNLNWLGRLIRVDDTSKDLSIEPTIESKYTVNSAIKLNLENGASVSKIRKTYSNYEAFDRRNRYENLSEEKIIDQLESRYKAPIKEYTVANLADITENVEETFTINKDASFDHIGNKLYLSPLSFFGWNENPFKDENRAYPIDFIYPNSNLYGINIEIPEGYEVDFLPKSKKFITGSNSVEARWILSNDDKVVRVRFTLNYNNAYVEAKEYVDIKKIFEEIVKFSDEKIVLKKKI